MTNNMSDADHQRELLTNELVNLAMEDRLSAVTATAVLTSCSLIAQRETNALLRDLIDRTPPKADVPAVVTS